MRYKLATILIFSAVGARAQQTGATDMSASVVKEGKNGIYLFLPAIQGRENANNVIVYKASGNEKFQRLGMFRPAADLQEFTRIAGKNTIGFLRRLKKLSSDNAVWDYISLHRNVKDYGLLATNIAFLQAMGKCYIDIEAKGAKPGTVLRYKINVLGANALDSMLTVRITTGKKPAITAPVISKLIEEDSVVVVEWTAPVAGNADASSGQVWRKSGNLGAYELAGYALAIKNEKQTQITYTWHEKVKRDIQFYYYLLPATIAGLEGPASDTAMPLSRNFKALAQGDAMNATDTSNGIYLCWQSLPETELVAAIIIERSKEPQRGYQVIDTIAANSTAYTDTRVLPGYGYHYRIRTLSIRQQVSQPSAHASAIYRATGIVPEAPENIRIITGEKNIRIQWSKSPYTEIAGYYVYRNSGEAAEWKLISDLVKDSVFTDTSLLSSRTVYGYAVASVNYNQQQSELSDKVSGTISARQVPPPPTGLQAIADMGRVLLAWNNGQQADDQVAFYNVYRKEITNAFRESAGDLRAEGLLKQGYIKINRQAIPSATYTDAATVGGTQYAYAITAIDNFGVEGSAYGVSTVNTHQALLLPPAQVAARKTKKGIEITWDANLQRAINGYVILRREPGNTALVQVGAVTADKTSFTDARVSTGKLYIYSVKTTGSGAASQNSVEKSVRY